MENVNTVNQQILAAIKFGVSQKKKKKKEDVIINLASLHLTSMLLILAFPHLVHIIGQTYLWQTTSSYSQSTSSRGDRGTLAHFLKKLTYLKKFDMDEPKILFIWKLTYSHIYVNWAKSFNLIKFRVYVTFLNALEMG